MPVLAEFSPQGQPGQLAAVGRGIDDADQSWMDRTQARRIREAQEQRQAAEFEIVQPVLQAKANADRVKLATELEVAQKMQKQREMSYGLKSQADEAYNEIIRETDPELREQRVYEWTGAYSQLGAIAEMADDIKAKKETLGTFITESNAMRRLREQRKLEDEAFTSEMKTFDKITEGFSEEEKAQAQRVRMGLEARPSGAAIQYREVISPDGSTRLVAVDPRSVGARVIGSGESYGTGVGPVSQPNQGRQPGQANVFQGQTPGEKEAQVQDEKAKAEREAQRPKREAAIKNAETASVQIIQDIDKMLSKVDATTVGPAGVAAALIPGTPAYALKTEMASVLSRIASQALTAMRQASPTGGALGNVSNYDVQLLERQLGALNQGLGPETFKASVETIRERLKEAIERQRIAFDSEYAPKADFKSMTDEQLQQRLNQLRGQ